MNMGKLIHDHICETCDSEVVMVGISLTSGLNSIYFCEPCFHEWTKRVQDPSKRYPFNGIRVTIF